MKRFVLSTVFVICLFTLGPTNIGSNQSLGASCDGLQPSSSEALLSGAMSNAENAGILVHGESLGSFQQALLDALGKLPPLQPGFGYQYIVIAAWTQVTPKGLMFHVCIQVVGVAPGGHQQVGGIKLPVQ